MWNLADVEAMHLVRARARATERARELFDAGYQLLHVLGVGGGGAVYKAIQRSTGQAVAIKLLSVDRLEAGIRRRREPDLPEVEVWRRGRGYGDRSPNR